MYTVINLKLAFICLSIENIMCLSAANKFSTENKMKRIRFQPAPLR